MLDASGSRHDPSLKPATTKISWPLTGSQDCFPWIQVSTVPWRKSSIGVMNTRGKEGKPWVSLTLGARVKTARHTCPLLYNHCSGRVLYKRQIWNALKGFVGRSTDETKAWKFQRGSTRTMARDALRVWFAIVPMETSRALSLLECVGNLVSLLSTTWPKELVLAKMDSRQNIVDTRGDMPTSVVFPLGATCTWLSRKHEDAPCQSNDLCCIYIPFSKRHTPCYELL